DQGDRGRAVARDPGLADHGRAEVAVDPAAGVRRVLDPVAVLAVGRDAADAAADGAVRLGHAERDALWAGQNVPAGHRREWTISPNRNVVVAIQRSAPAEQQLSSGNRLSIDREPVIRRRGRCALLDEGIRREETKAIDLRV